MALLTLSKGPYVFWYPDNSIFMALQRILVISARQEYVPVRFQKSNLRISRMLERLISIVSGCNGGYMFWVNFIGPV